MIGRLRRYIDAHGLRATLATIAERLLGGVVSDRRIAVYVKSLDAIVEPRRRSELEVVELGRDSLPGLSELNRRRGRRRVDRRFRSNLERGLHGFVGLRDGVTVGYYWWIEEAKANAHPDLDWLGKTLPIEPGDVYGSDFYILPEYRDGGTGNEFLFHVEAGVKAAGFSRIWGYVDGGNRQASWLYSSRGYQPMMEVRSRRILFHRRTTVLPKVG